MESLKPFGEIVSFDEKDFSVEVKMTDFNDTKANRKKFLKALEAATKSKFPVCELYNSVAGSLHVIMSTPEDPAFMSRHLPKP